MPKGICRYCKRLFSDSSDLAELLENSEENPICDQEYEDIEAEYYEITGKELPDEVLDLGICYDCQEEFL